MPLSLPEGDFDAYIFDCDGTLADTMALHLRAWNLLLRELGMEPFERSLFYSLGGIPTERIVEILNEQRHSCLPVVETSVRKERLFEAMIPQVQPIEPVVAVARQWFGKKPLAVASGGYREAVWQTLRALGIIDWFSVIVCGEDYEHPKPAPDAFLEAARRLGVRPGCCLAFEDSQLGIRSATAAGMRAVWVEAGEF